MRLGIPASKPFANLEKLMRINLPTLSLTVVLTLLLFLSMAPCAFGVTDPRFAFVANANDNTISVYTVNATSGFLRDNGYVAVGAKPSGVTVAPNGKFLYVADSGAAGVSAFSVSLQ